jgi:dipeptidyl-peptidase-4
MFRALSAPAAFLIARIAATRLAFLLCACAGLTWADTPPAPTSQQVSRDTYARAEALLPDRVDALVLNEQVTVHWLGSRDEFWYRRETATGHEFVIVDAPSGRKRPAFDHRALAKALTAATGTSVDAARLPFDAFEPVGAGLKQLGLNIAGKSYVCELRRKHCEVRAPGDPAPAGMLASPDGRWGAFSRNGNLWLRNLESGAERALTSDGEANFGYGIYPDNWNAAYVPRERSGMSLPPYESYWSPDSQRLVVSRLDQRHVAAYPFVENAPRDGSFRPKLHSVRIPLVGERPPTLEWFAFDIPSGAQRRIEYPYDKLLMPQQTPPIQRTWWGPRGDQLFAVAFGDNMESAALYVADLATGKVRTVIEESSAPRTDLNSSSYNPPNVRVTQDGREAIWFSQRDGWGHLYLYDVASGALKNRITAGDWLVRDIVKVDERRRRIYFTAGGREPGNPYYRYLYRIDFDGSGLTLLSPEPGDHLIAASWVDGPAVVSPSGEYAVYDVSPLEQTTRTLIRRTADARLVATIEQADASRLYAAGYRAPEEFVVKAADGKSDLYGLMYKPTDFDPARKYPVVDHQYASPLTATVPRSFVQAVQGVTGYGSPASTAQLGFIVVVIDARGTSYRSREFSQAGYGHLNTNGLDDHVAAIRQLAERHAFIDIERVGLTGASYGGWSTLRGMIEFPDFFKAGVAGVPPGSLHSMYLDYHWTAFQGRPRYSDGSQWRPNATEAPLNWEAANSLEQAGRIQGKLLIVMGELDENVPPGAPLQFINALIAANRDFELVYLPDTNHFESRRPYTIRRAWDFLVRHLQRQEPPQYEIKGAQ